MSGRASSLPSAHLDMWERSFLSIRKGLSPPRGQARESLPETRFTLTVIGRVRGCRPQVILNRLDAKPWEVLEISALGYSKGVADENSFLVYTWEGAYSRVFDVQFFAPSLK